MGKLYIDWGWPANRLGGGRGWFGSEAGRKGVGHITSLSRRLTVPRTGWVTFTAFRIGGLYGF